MRRLTAKPRSAIRAALATLKLYGGGKKARRPLARSLSSDLAPRLAAKK